MKCFAIPIYIENEHFREKFSRQVRILKTPKKFLPLFGGKKIVFFEELEDGTFNSVLKKEMWKKGDKRFVEKRLWKFQKIPKEK